MSTFAIREDLLGVDKSPHDHGLADLTVGLENMDSDPGYVRVTVELDGHIVNQDTWGPLDGGTHQGHVELGHVGPGPHSVRVTIEADQIAGPYTVKFEFHH
jgi:hypothetical protein